MDTTNAARMLVTPFEATLPRLVLSYKEKLAYQDWTVLLIERLMVGEENRIGMETARNEMSSLRAVIFDSQEEISRPLSWLVSKYPNPALIAAVQS